MDGWGRYMSRSVETGEKVFGRGILLSTVGDGSGVRSVPLLSEMKTGFT